MPTKRDDTTRIGDGGEYRERSLGNVVLGACTSLPLYIYSTYDASTHERGIHTHRMRVAIASCRTPPSARHRYRIHDTSGHSHHARVRPRASSQPQGNAGDRPDAAETIDKLLSRAQEAVVDAERTVEHLEDLPSARLPTTFDKAMRLMRPLLKAAALVAYCWTMHAFGMTVRLAGGFLLAGAVGVRGYRNLSLSPSGALAALVVGWATVSSSFRAGLVLLGFFFVSSALTAFGEENKDVEEGHKKGGQRNWIQVGFISVARDRRWPSRGQLTPAHSLTRSLAHSLTRLLARPPARQVYSNGAVPAILATAAAAFSAGKDLALLPMSTDPLYSLLTAAFLGYIACCAGDTWVFVSLARLPALPMHAHSLAP